MGVLVEEPSSLRLLAWRIGVEHVNEHVRVDEPGFNGHEARRASMSRSLVRSSPSSTGTTGARSLAYGAPPRGIGLQEFPENCIDGGVLHDRAHPGALEDFVVDRNGQVHRPPLANGTRDKCSADSCPSVERWRHPGVARGRARCRATPGDQGAGGHGRTGPCGRPGHGRGMAVRTARRVLSMPHLMDKSALVRMEDPRVQAPTPVAIITPRSRLITRAVADPQRPFAGTWSPRAAPAEARRAHSAPLYGADS